MLETPGESSQLRNKFKREKLRSYLHLRLQINYVLNDKTCLLLSDIDECAVRPCQNGGNCTDAINDYDCNCAAGYSGKNCTIGKNDVLSKKIIL